MTIVTRSTRPTGLYSCAANEVGACPFECCSYHEWTTNAPVRLYADVGSKSVIVTVDKGEKVMGVTGVVITTKAGRIKILQPITLDENNPVEAAPGDLLYTLHYLGEGYDRFWFKNEVHDAQLGANQIVLKPKPPEQWRVLAQPKTEWWVNVRTTSGQVGWSKETEKFDHMDACE
jgi:hypothetical protein